MKIVSTRVRAGFGARGFAVLLLAFSGLPFSGGLHAQTTATVQGTVLSAVDGAPLPGVAIRVVAVERVVLSDARGRFALSGIQPGRQEIVASRLGLEPASQIVELDAGAVATVTFRLSEQALLIPAVVVSASGETRRLSETTASVGVISASDLREARPTHPSAVMSQVPGVWVNVTGGEGHMTAIRQPIGTKPLYLFLEDGVPTRSTGFFNHNALYEVNLPQADRVEVLKGPASALYGSDAIGGIINTESRRPSSSPTAEAFVEGGRFGFGRILASASNTFRDSGVRVDVNLTRTDGWREATGYDRQTATLRWDSHLGARTALRTVLTGSRIHQQTAGSSALARDQYTATPSRNTTPISLRNVRAVRFSTTAETRWDRSMLTLTPFLRWNDMELLPNWSLTYDPTVYTTGHSSLGLVARFRRDFDPLQGRIIAGIDLDHSPGYRLENRISTTRTDGVFTGYELGDVIYDYDVTFEGISPYLQAEAQPTARLHLTGGLRFDHMRYIYRSNLPPLQTGRWKRPADADPSYSSVSPKIGASYDFGPAANLFANYTQGFRAPSEGQIFRQGPAENTLELDPVHASSYEVGLRGQLGRGVGYSLAVYHMTLTDDILGYTLADGTPETQNAGETLHRGVEAGMTVRLLENLTGNLSYTLAKHTYERWSPRPGVDYAGKEMEAAPSSVLNARLDYHPSVVPGARVGIEWNRLGAYWLDPQNSVRYEGHDLLNFHGSAPLPGGLEVVARLMNATDRLYAELATYTSARGEELAPGMPRTVYLGVQYAWER